MQTRPLPKRHDPPNVWTVPKYGGLVDVDDLPDPTEAQGDAMGFEAARGQYLKEQFISDRNELPELDELLQPEELQEAEAGRPGHRHMIRRRRKEQTKTDLPAIRVGSTAIAKWDSLAGRAGDMAVCWRVDRHA